MARLLVGILRFVLRVALTPGILAGVVVLINFNILLGLVLVGSLAVGVWYRYRRGRPAQDRSEEPRP